MHVEFWLHVSKSKAILCCIGMATEPTNGGLHNEVKTVTIRIFSSHDSAQLAAANLEAHGIE
jgi:hypothetical protein